MAKEQMMTAGEVADYLQCSVTTVRRFASRGKMPHYRLGKLVRFRRSEIEHWLALYHEGEISAETRGRLTNPDQLSLFQAAE